MEQILFCKTFIFRTVRLNSSHHSDNSNGIPCHFIARMHSGSAIIRAVSGEELYLRAGDIFYLPMGLQYHSYWMTDETGDRSVSWETYGFTHLPVPNEARYAMQKIFPTEEAVGWLDRLKKDQEVSPASVGYLYLFLSEVLSDMRVSDCDPKAAMFRKAFDYIQKHESFAVPEVARVCGISESGLYALFRDYAHTTPVDIKHRIIVERAVALLTSTNLTIETIAYDLGLCSSAYLRRILKKQTGRTPSQIRKESKLM